MSESTYPETSSFEPPKWVVKPQKNDKIIKYVKRKFRRKKFNEILNGVKLNKFEDS